MSRWQRCSDETLRVQLALVKEAKAMLLNHLGREPVVEDGWDYYEHEGDVLRIEEIEEEIFRRAHRCPTCGGTGLATKKGDQ